MMIREIILSTILLYQSAGGATIFTPKPQPVEQVVAAEEEMTSEISEETNDIELKGVEEEMVLVWGNGHCELVRFADTNMLIKVRIYDKNEGGFNQRDGKLFLQDLIDLCEELDIGGVPLEAMLAQAYTEGGAGKQGVYKKSNNLFGIRAGRSWYGYVYARDLKQTFSSFESAFAAGGRDLFRAYDDMTDSIKDYLHLIHTSALYRGALGKSPKRYLKHLVEHGYGDPAMVDVWLNIIKIYHLKGIGKR